MPDDALARVLADLAADGDGDGPAIAAHVAAAGLDGILASLDDPELDGGSDAAGAAFDPAWHVDGG